MQATADAAAMSWTGGLRRRRCAERVTINGDPRWGMAVHAATRRETCAYGRLIASIDAHVVMAAAASRAGDQS
jgi:hypothetical protein